MPVQEAASGRKLPFKRGTQRTGISLEPFVSAELRLGSVCCPSSSQLRRQLHGGSPALKRPTASMLEMQRQSQPARPVRIFLT
jgi:hypothetical protein